MEAALYDPVDGFYEVHGGAGRRGDFLTAPEVGPLFGVVVARALDRWWHELGAPALFTVVEVGAGPGTLARAVLAARPACAPALRYVLVERSAAARASHGRHLRLEPAEEAFPDRPDPDPEEGSARAVTPGPIVVSVAELPQVELRGVVLANELLDNLAPMLAERTDAGWSEVRVDVGADGVFGEVTVPLVPGLAARVAALAGDVPTGSRVPVQAGAALWVRDVLDRLVAGRLVVLDYAATTGELARRPSTEWLRTYRGHAPGGHPLDDPGSQDVTCEVAVDQLSPAPDHQRSQAEWLAVHGLGELVEEGRRTWTERAAIGDLAALEARSRVREAEALTDPSGLGAFQVLEWVVPRP